MLLIESGNAEDVFEVVAVEAALVRVRTAYLFEIGEELKLSVDGNERAARVRAHRRDGETELELVTP